MSISSHGAENVYSQVRANILLTDHSMCCYWTSHKTVSKILWTTCLITLLVQENIPSCCLFL